MKVDTKNMPRMFRVGTDKKIQISHQADIELSPNEQVTFFTEDGAEFDFVRKEWGYYVTPSINRRLKSFGFRTALVQNVKGQVYVFAVEDGKMKEFKNYCYVEEQTVLMWLNLIYHDDSPN